MSITTTARNATSADLVAILKDQHARKLDMVVPASKIRSSGGNIVVRGAEQLITIDGVTQADGVYRPTVVADEGIATKLGIPLSYIRRLRAERPDIFDANINSWLAGRTVVRDGERTVQFPADTRTFLLRAFRGDDGEHGVLRAFLSDKFALIENLDVLMAALAGVQAAGVEIDIPSADLTDRKMYVKVTAPGVQAHAPELLKNYRSPFSGARGADNPIVFAGFRIENSEVGNGAFSIKPEITVQVCNNGMTITKDVMRTVHLGSRMEEGTISWTQDTQEKAIALITAKARDAVTTFLDADYVRRSIADIEKVSGSPVSNAAETIKVVGKKLAYSEETMAGLLDHFIKGGDLTAGGVLHAVTSFSQTVADADAAADLNDTGLRAMELAAAVRL